MEPKLIQRQKLFEQVADHLEQQILDGKLKPGDRLPPERDLQAAFGVGRPAIREALITLERAGLVEIGNGAPARVAMPTAAGLIPAFLPSVRQMLSQPEGNRQLQAVRLLIEVGLSARRRAAPPPTTSPASGPRSRDNEACRRDRKAFIDSDVAFHYGFARIARNAVFLAIHDGMTAWLREQRVIALRADGETDRRLRRPRPILAAVEARDPDAGEGGDARPPARGLDLVLAARGRQGGGDAMILGAIADDFTGASDLANTLAKGGMRDVPLRRRPGRQRRPPARGRRRRARSRARSPPPRPSRSRSRRPRLAARPGLPADHLQILLDLRFDAAGQYRPGRRGAARPRSATSRPSVCPAFPGAGRTHLPGPSLRRRPAALRIRHGAPPADADDRPRHPPLAAAPDARRRSAIVAARRSLRGGRRSPRRSPPRRRRAPAVVVADAICDADLVASAGRRAAAGSSPAARASRSACRRTSRIARRRRRAAWRGDRGRPPRRSPARARPPPARQIAATAPPASRSREARPPRPVLDGDAERRARRRLGLGQPRQCPAGLFDRRPRRRWPRAQAAPRPRGDARTASSASAPPTAGGSPTRASAASSSPAARPPAPSSPALGIAALAIGPEIDPGVPALRRPRQPPARAGAQVRQLRRRRLLRPGRRRASPSRAMSAERRPARADLPLAPLALRARPDRRRQRQHLGAAPGRRLPRRPRPARASAASTRPASRELDAGPARRRRPAHQGDAAAHAPSTPPGRRRRRRPPAFDARGRAVLPRPTPTRTTPSRRSRPTR